MSGTEILNGQDTWPEPWNFKAESGCQYIAIEPLSRKQKQEAWDHLLIFHPGIAYSLRTLQKDPEFQTLKSMFDAEIVLEASSLPQSLKAVQEQ